MIPPAAAAAAACCRHAVSMLSACCRTCRRPPAPRRLDSRAALRGARVLPSQVELACRIPVAHASCPLPPIPQGNWVLADRFDVVWDVAGGVLDIVVFLTDPSKEQRVK